MSRPVVPGMSRRADPGAAAGRCLRRQVTQRARLVRQRSRIKNQVHAILARDPAPIPPVSDLFGTTDRQWLSRQ